MILNHEDTKAQRYLAIALAHLGIHLDNISFVSLCLCGSSNVIDLSQGSMA